MDLRRVKQAIGKAAAELAGAARDAELQSFDATLSEEDQKQLGALHEKLRKVAEVVSSLTSDTVRLESAVQTRAVEVRKNPKNRWRITS